MLKAALKSLASNDAIISNPIADIAKVTPSMLSTPFDRFFSCTCYGIINTFFTSLQFVCNIFCRMTIYF